MNVNSPSFVPRKGQTQTQTQTLSSIPKYIGIPTFKPPMSPFFMQSGYADRSRYGTRPNYQNFVHYPMYRTSIPSSFNLRQPQTQMQCSHKYEIIIKKRTPATPATPATPTTPATPATPATRATPATPTTPATPATRTTPATPPATPATPATTPATPPAAPATPPAVAAAKTNSQIIPKQLAKEKEVWSSSNDYTQQQRNKKDRQFNKLLLIGSNYNNQQQQQQQQQLKQLNGGNKSQQQLQQCNKWCNNKRQDAQKNAGHKHCPTAGFFSYIYTCGEDNIVACNEHRNSTSSDTAVSGDDMNSGNEDMNPNHKTTKSRRLRQQQKRKNVKFMSLCLGDECKGTKRLANNNNGVCGVQQHGSNSSVNKTGNINLRKHCTEAAALKAVYQMAPTPTRRNSTIANPLATSASNSSVVSILSKSSSSSSIALSASSALHTPSSSAYSSPTASPTINKRKAQNIKKLVQENLRTLQPVQNLTEAQLVERLNRYKIPCNLLRIIGYPQESTKYAGCAEIFKCLPHTDILQNAGQLINSNDGLTMTAASTNVDSAASLSGDSGQGSSENSSPPSALDSDACEEMPISVDANEICTQKENYQILTQYNNSTEKQCVRCKRAFHVTESGKYIDKEQCLSHAGKLQQVYRPSNGISSLWSCCSGEKYSNGCTTNAVHVWNGTVLGINGPYRDYVHTRPRSTGYDTAKSPTKIYALDCEMSYTGRGLEATKISVIGFNGKLVYEKFIRPEAEIVDYNTRYSGICEEDLARGKRDVSSLQEVQQDLLKLFSADTILVGHALDNDLRSLRMVHHTVVDTSLSFHEPCSSCFPNRRSLKSLTELYLKRQIQCGSKGHKSFEDALAALELILWKVQHDFQNTDLPLAFPWAAF